MLSLTRSWQFFHTDIKIHLNLRSRSVFSCHATIQRFWKTDGLLSAVILCRSLQKKHWALEAFTFLPLKKFFDLSKILDCYLSSKKFF